jgi:hypothetical protein
MERPAEAVGLSVWVMPDLPVQKMPLGTEINYLFYFA